MLPKINIRNFKTYQGNGYDVGRPMPLGNPFLVETYGRRMAIEYYKEWLNEKLDDPNSKQIKAFSSIYEDMMQGKTINLICHCSPLKCHAEYIKELLIQAYKESQK